MQRLEYLKFSKPIFSKPSSYLDQWLGEFTFQGAKWQKYCYCSFSLQAITGTDSQNRLYFILCDVQYKYALIIGDFNPDTRKKKTQLQQFLRNS